MTCETRAVTEPTALTEAKTKLAELQVKKIEQEIEQLERENRNERSDEYQARVYTFNDIVTSDSVHDCLEVLGEWHRADPTCKITLVINTAGGSVFDGLALFDYIRYLVNQGHEVETMGLGKVLSMGSVLLQAGSKRTMTKHSYLMIHEISTIMGGRASGLVDELKLMERIQKRLLAILAEKSSMDEHEVATHWLRKDWWLDTDEALELGFIDEIAAK